MYRFIMKPHMTQQARRRLCNKCTTRGVYLHLSTPGSTPFSSRNKCFDHTQGSRQATALPQSPLLSRSLRITANMSSSPPSSNPSFSMSAYMIPSNQHSYDSDDEVASLPSESTTESDLETLSDDYSDAEAEWRESIEQLELLLTMVLVPFIGKYMGRKCAYWSRSSCPQNFGYALLISMICRLDAIHDMEVPS